MNWSSTGRARLDELEVDHARYSTAHADPVTEDPQFEDLVPVGTPIDLDNCAREPIHIPGSIQPRGVLAVVREPDFEVRQVSANVAELLGRSVDDVLGRHLSALIGNDQAALIEQAASNFGDLRERNPLDCTIDVDGDVRLFDAILRREPGGVLLVELEIAHGVRPFSFPNTYQAVRGAVEELNRAATLDELYDTTARAVRDLTVLRPGHGVPLRRGIQR